MINVFVDESGNLGQKGGRYFVICILVPKKSKRIANLIKNFCAEFILEEIKAYYLSFSQKQKIFNKIISVDDYSISYIVADKFNIENKKLFQDNNLLYNYLFSFLIEETIKTAKEDIHILLDNHSIKTKSINSLCDYIKIKALTEWGYKGNLQISYVDSRRSKTVQAADLISNAIYAYYEFGKKHFYSLLSISKSIKFPYSRFGK